MTIENEDILPRKGGRGEGGEGGKEVDEVEQVEEGRRRRGGEVQASG